MRFTLRFLGVTMAALASAGMTLHTRLWAEAIVSFSVLLYIAAAILSFRGGGQVRAFRFAFAVVGARLCASNKAGVDAFENHRVFIQAEDLVKIDCRSTLPGTLFIPRHQFMPPPMSDDASMYVGMQADMLIHSTAISFIPQRRPARLTGPMSGLK
jgi:hypothetical protein